MMAASDITSDTLAALLVERESLWRAKLPAQRPFLAGLPADFANFRAPDGPQQALVEELRRVADEICDGHWLRVYAHKPHVTLAAREIMGASPNYRPWQDFVIVGQIEADAEQELWQRDVGDNMVALALAALMWQEPQYVETLRAHVLAALQYPTWGAFSRYNNMDLPCAHLARGIAIARD